MVRSPAGAAADPSGLPLPLRAEGAGPVHPGEGVSGGLRRDPEGWQHIFTKGRQGRSARPESLWERITFQKEGEQRLVPGKWRSRHGPHALQGASLPLRTLWRSNIANMHPPVWNLLWDLSPSPRPGRHPRCRTVTVASSLPLPMLCHGNIPVNKPTSSRPAE